MKRINLLYIAIFMVAILAACNPIEDKENIGGAITAEQLDISATSIIVNGKKSNKVIVVNNSPILSEWDYGTGKTNRQSDTILLVVEGTTEIVFTGLNPDGTFINKTLSVNVEDLAFEVPKEWGYLCGDGEKEWVWDSSQEVWGNGGYLNDSKPAWWKLTESEIDGQAKNEGVGASMIFSIKGASLTKVKADKSTVKGSFSFDITKTKLKGDGTLWAKGVLKTNATSVLCGISPNEGGKTVTEYDILYLDDTQMILAYPEPGDNGNAWFWVFKAK